MNNTNLKINEKCIQCGSCLGYGFNFLSSVSDGSIVVSSGTFLDKNDSEFKSLKEICPVDAFELEKTIDKKRVLNNIIQELKKYSGISTPCQKDLKFRAEEYSIPLPIALGERRYDYTSSKAAEKAALQEFERAMYSQIDNIILRIITEYRVKYVKPYYAENLEEGSVYAISNKKVTEMLEGVKKILEKELPADFTNVRVFPNKDIVWQMLNKGEMVSDELVSAVKSEFDYPSSQYDCYWTIDDMEVVVGKDWRGNMKWKDKYCYKNIGDAFQELAKDILNACHYARDDIEKQAVCQVQWLVETYNEELKKTIDKKIKQIESVNR